jgi:hypothetical protein
MKGNRKVELTCPCGKVFTAWSNNIRYRGHSGKCRGCRRTEQASKLYPPFQRLFNHLKCQAINREIEFVLTFEEFLGFTEQPLCFYCDAQLEWQGKVPRGENLGGYKLDRKDPAGIYEKTNLVQCCGICNRIKSDRFTFEQMCSLAPALKALNIQISKF